MQINHFCFKRYCRYCINIYRSYISESSLCQKLPVCISVCGCLYVLYMLAVHSSWVSKITLTRLQLWLSVCHWCVKSCRCLSVWPIAVLAHTPTRREQRGHAKSNREALFLHCAGVWLRLIVFRSVAWNYQKMFYYFLLTDALLSLFTSSPDHRGTCSFSAVQHLNVWMHCFKFWQMLVVTCKALLHF